MKEGAKDQGAVSLARSEENFEGMCYFLMGVSQMNSQTGCVFKAGWGGCVLGH